MMGAHPPSLGSSTQDDASLGCVFISSLELRTVLHLSFFLQPNFFMMEISGAVAVSVEPSQMTWLV